MSLSSLQLEASGVRVTGGIFGECEIRPRIPCDLEKERPRCQHAEKYADVLFYVYFFAMLRSVLCTSVILNLN
jgi:hypothetical protein